MKAKKKVVPAPAAQPSLVVLSDPQPDRKHRIHFPTSLDEIEGLSDADLREFAGMASELGRALWLEQSRRKNLKDPQLQGLADMDRRTRNHVLIYLAKRDPEFIPF